MPNTFVKIASVTVGSGGSSTITFSSIPQTYTDLVMVLSGRGVSGDQPAFSVSINGSTTTNLTSRALYGTGSATGSSSYSELIGGLMPGSSQTSNVFNSTVVYITNYSASNNKSISLESVGENNATGAYQWMAAGLYSSSTAITSAGFTGSVNFVQYSSATLYGIKSS